MKAGVTEAEQEQQSEQSPESLCRRIEAGDARAEAELYSRYRRGVLFLLTKRCGDPELAADITHDALWKVILAARKSDIREPAALNGYVRSVAINLMIAHHRKTARQSTSATDPTEENQFPDTESESILESLKRDQLGPIADGLLTFLKSDRDRDVLRRYYLQDEDKQSICSAWELTSSQFDTVLYRARQRLRQILVQRYRSSDLLGRVEALIALIVLMPLMTASSPCDSPLKDSSDWRHQTIEAACSNGRFRG